MSNIFQFTDETKDMWAERFRPSSLEQLVGNERIKAKMAKYIEDGKIPHLLFHGPSGTGKTSLAYILADSLDCDVKVINASDENNVETVRKKVKQFASTMGFRSGKIIVLDEFEYMSKSAQAILRNLMEKYVDNCRFILTCNHVDMVIDPIKSRCQVHHIEPPSKKAVAKHMVHILKSEEVLFEKEDLVTIINANYPDMRQIIHTIQDQVNDKGWLELDTDSIMDNELKAKLIQFLADGRSVNSSFADIRQLIANNHVTKFVDLYKFLFDNLQDFAEGNETAVILIIADYLYKDSLIVDSEINFMAMIIELLNELR